MNELAPSGTANDEEIKRGFGVLCTACDSEILLGLIHLGSDAQVSELPARVDITTQPTWVDCQSEKCTESTLVERGRLVFVDVTGWVYQAMADRWTRG
jgi:hypothetical protein